MARAKGLLGERQHITDAKIFKRAKKSLGIKSLRAGFGACSRWLWELPQPNEPSLKTQQSEATPDRCVPIDWEKWADRAAQQRWDAMALYSVVRPTGPSTIPAAPLSCGRSTAGGSRATSRLGSHRPPSEQIAARL
jgi:hypothetical protein